MEGYTHALSGAAAWMALTSTTAAASGQWEQSSAVVLGGAVVCAGWALCPDADHLDGTIAHSLPPLTNVMTRSVHRLSGGHRHGTHSLLGILVFAALAALAALPAAQVHGKTIPIGSAIVATLCIAFASKALGLASGLGFRGVVGDIMRSPLGNWIIALAGGLGVTWFLDYRWPWLPACAALGAYVHVLGDSMTPEGVPWLWPWNPKPSPWWPRVLRSWWKPNGYMGIPLFGTTQTRGPGARAITREHVFAFVLGLYVLYVMSAEVARCLDVTLPYVH